MRVPRVYGTASDVYRQNNYLNDSEHQVGGGCEFHEYTGARQTSIGKIIPDPKWQGMRVSRVYWSASDDYRQSNYLNNS